MYSDLKQYSTHNRRRQPERPSGVIVLYGAVVITWALLVAIVAAVTA